MFNDKNYVCMPLTGLNSVESYDPRTNEWRLVASMSTRRSSVGVGVVGGKKKLVYYLLSTYFINQGIINTGYMMVYLLLSKNILVFILEQPYYLLFNFLIPIYA